MSQQCEAPTCDYPATTTMPDGTRLCDECADVYPMCDTMGCPNEATTTVMDAGRPRRVCPEHAG